MLATVAGLGGHKGHSQDLRNEHGGHYKGHSFIGTKFPRLHRSADKRGEREALINKC
jgi:hypothetical protein